MLVYRLIALLRRPLTLLYRIRYGDRPLSEDEQREVDQQVQHLEMGLISAR